MHLWVALGVAAGFFVGILAHGYAHTVAAARAGDRTGRLYGRHTLKPKAHFDPVGSIVFPAVYTVAALVSSPFPVMFGWGKKHVFNLAAIPRRRQVWVLLAGPLATLALAIIGAVTVRSLGGSTLLGGGLDCVASPLVTVAYWFAWVNVFLTVVELLPVPGRDGARLLARSLSPAAQLKFEELAEYDVLFVIGLLLVLSGVLRGIVGPVLQLVLGANCPPLG